MILVAYAHGLRVSEVVSLKREDIEGGFLTVQRLKGSLKTTQPLMEHKNPLLNERQRLLAYMTGMHAKQRIFPITRQHCWWLFRKYGKAAGIAKHLCHPHTAKHSTAMHTIHSAGIENVRQWLGHRNMSSTGEYLKVTDSEAGRAISKAIKGS